MELRKYKMMVTIKKATEIGMKVKIHVEVLQTTDIISNKKKS